MTNDGNSIPLYGSFSDSINQDSVKRFINNLTITLSCTNPSYSSVHILFQSNGGSVTDGINLYNFLRSFPLDITLYASGGVQSIAVISYLGAKHRIAIEHTLFMIHRTWISPMNVNSSRLKELSNMLKMEDDRTYDILRSRLKLTKRNWEDAGRSEFWFTASDAVKSGLAESIGSFNPMKSLPLWNFNL